MDAAGAIGMRRGMPADLDVTGETIETAGKPLSNRP